MRYGFATRLRAFGSSALLVLVALAILAPVVLLLSISVQSSGDVARNPLGFPFHIHLENYVNAFLNMNYLRSVGNTALITACTTVIVVFFGSLAAWAIARNVSRWTRAAYSFFVAGLTIPFFVAMTPLYLLMQQLHLLDTYAGVILIYSAANLPLAVFFFSSFLKSVPAELEEAGAIDGLGIMGTYWHIVLPLLRPAAATLIIFVTLGVWNDLIVPLLFLSSDSSQTVILSVYSFVGVHSTDTSQLFPAVVLGTLPLFVLFLFLQKHIVAGVAAGVGK